MYVDLMSWGTDFKFTVEKPEAAPVSPWAVKEVAAYQTDENLKKQFGIELAKSTTPFEAGCKIFGEDTGKALWASFNWLTDPVVIASRDIYLKTLELSAAPLDRGQLAAKVLKLAEGDKVEVNGILRSTVEAKDRIAAFKLYSDILGYTGKVEIDNSQNNTINEIVIKLVKAGEEKLVKTIENVPKLEIKNENSNSPITLKLVGGARA